MDERKEHGVEIVNGPGGCAFVTDPKRPHLGGNLDGGDLGTQYPHTLWPWLYTMFRPETMADIGCGQGAALRWFQARGVKTLGLDGLEYNIKMCPQPAVVHDLTLGPYLFPKVDLIWCCDVAEHIEERFVDNLLQTITQCRTLAMCQGGPAHANQGWHHVNNKPPEYWAEALARYDMLLEPAATIEANAVEGGGWWGVSGAIYLRRE